MFVTVAGAAALVAGWVIVVAIDMDWTPFTIGLPIHNLLVGVLAASSVALLVGELNRRLTLHEHAGRPTPTIMCHPAEPTYAQGVVDGMRLVRASIEEIPTVELNVAVGSNVRVLRPRPR